MSKLTQNILLGLFIFVLAVVGLTGYSLRTMPRMIWESKRVLNEFYVHSRAGRYTQAHQLLSDDMQRSLSAAALGKQWTTFEQSHGRIKNWVPAGGGTASGGDKISFFSRYVIFSHKVTGKNGSSGLVTVRLAPQGGRWRITNLKLVP